MMKQILESEENRRKWINFKKIEIWLSHRPLRQPRNKPTRQQTLKLYAQLVLEAWNDSHLIFKQRVNTGNCNITGRTAFDSRTHCSVKMRCGHTWTKTSDMDIVFLELFGQGFGIIENVTL